jgi:phosphohistidine phosphatase
MPSLGFTFTFTKMKHLLIVRHAKSDWNSKLNSDFDRTINDRGRKNARELGQVIHNLRIPIQTIYASTATRAKSTAEIMVSEMPQYHGIIQLKPELYLPKLEVFERFVFKLDDALNQIIIVGHNPSSTQLIRNLSGKIIDEVKTASLTHLTFETGNWTSIKPQNFVAMRYHDHYNWHGHDVL